jgi:type IV pilus assembly protein PilM
LLVKLMPLTSIPRPRIACEISADRLVAARAGEKGAALEAASTAALPPGMLTPGLQQENIPDRTKLLPALRESLSAVAARSRDICVIIPDASTRVLLLDFETLPDKAVDADAVVRFRLKKSLPFDVDQCSISFDRQSTASPVRVVAAVTPRTVLEEYESLVVEAGYNPGAVLPSMIASLGLVDASRPTMVIKVERGTTTFAIVDQDQLLLYRALDNGGNEVSGESLVDDVNTSLVYFEDRYGVGVDRMLVTGVRSTEGLEAALSGTSSIKVEELVSSTLLGAAAGNVNRSALAGVMGALVA